MATVATAMAGLRRIGRINKYNDYPSILGFVVHKLPQLIERPGVVLRPMHLADLRALPYPGQLFEGDGFLSRPGRGNKLFADDVVDRAHMTPLLSREPFQEPFGSPCAFGLERTSDFEGVGTERLDSRAFIGSPQRIDGNPSTAQVDTQHAHIPLTAWGRRLDLDVQKEGPIAPLDQCSTGGRLALQAGCLMVSRCGVKVLGVGATRRSPLLKMR